MGCPCASEGAVAPCGTLISREADWVSCGQGQSVCQGGTWSSCSGGTIVTKSVRSSTIGRDAARFLATATPCTDPCDPFGCMAFVEGPGDVDASGLTTSDAGVSLRCSGLECQLSSCPDGGTTTLVGTVFDPAGRHPIADAYVYVPIDPSGALVPLASGASCEPCSGQLALPAVAAARTAPDGTFTLPNVPSTDVAPNGAIPFVVQKGKWRREAWLDSVPACATTSVDPSNSHLPANRFDGAGDAGDIPKMAIATASTDALECMMYKAGVDPNEFQFPTDGGRGRIDTYVANGGGLSAPAGSPPPIPVAATGLSPLVDNLDTLLSYDAVILPCEGEKNIGVDPVGFGNAVTYANAGGRLLATHLGFEWVVSNASLDGGANSANPFSQVASWNRNGTMISGSEMAVVDSHLADGTVSALGSSLDEWLNAVGALSTASDWHMPVVNAGGDIASVNPIATEWLHDSAGSGEPFALGFDTPLPDPDAGPDAAAGNCGRVFFADFHGEYRTSSGVCTPDLMSPQELLLEYMFFDLTSCVSPDSQAQPVPTNSFAYAPASFTEDFISSCPDATRIAWRALSWNATIPPTASIEFTAQTVDLPGDGGAPDFSGAQSIALLTTTTSTSPPGSEILLDINALDGGAPIGAFAQAVPPVESKGALRLTFTLEPTSDGLSTPVLMNWQVTSDCLPSE